MMAPLGKSGTGALSMVEARPGLRLAVVSAEVDDPADAFKRWRDDVWKFMRRLGVPVHRLEDATQDVFIVACRNWLVFEGRSTRKVWIYGIAARVARQHLRHRSNKEANGDFAIVEETTTLGVWGSTPLGPFDSTARGEARRSLQKILACLCESHREILVLVVLEHQSIAEAALALGLTGKAAERRLERAYGKFNKALQRYRAEDERRLR
jgi:RNA polymerase sigma factor (sigma-70 family)